MDNLKGVREVKRNYFNTFHPILFLVRSIYSIFFFIFFFEGKYIFANTQDIPSEKIVIKYWVCRIKTHMRSIYTFIFGLKPFFMCPRDYLLRVQKNEDISSAIILKQIDVELMNKSSPYVSTTKRAKSVIISLYGISSFAFF